MLKAVSQKAAYRHSVRDLLHIFSTFVNIDLIVYWRQTARLPADFLLRAYKFRMSPRQFFIECTTATSYVVRLSVDAPKTYGFLKSLCILACGLILLKYLLVFRSTHLPFWADWGYTTRLKCILWIFFIVKGKSCHHGHKTHFRQSSGFQHFKQKAPSLGVSFEALADRP